MYGVERKMALEPMEENWFYLELIWGTLIYFTFMQRHQFPSILVTVFLGTLWSFIMQIKPPFMLDEEHGIALHAM